jgi:Tol biopolymer transport system component
MVAMAVTLPSLFLLLVGVVAAQSEVGGTIAFSTVSRLSYAFDVYTLELDSLRETRETLGESVSYNAQLVKGSASLRERLGVDDSNADLEFLVYVSEVEGSPQLYLDLPLQGSKVLKRRHKLRDHAPPKVYLMDRPHMNGDIVVFVSTEEEFGFPLQAWNAVYSLNFKTSEVKRLTPRGVTDYSPALSPSGEWVAVASNEGRGWTHETESLYLDLYIFKAEDGSQRRLILKNAGWPTWSDDKTVYFHRIAHDGWWSIFRIDVTSGSNEAERITPPGVHAFTPAASTSGKWIAVATRRASTRHIEIFDLEEKKFIPVTARINPTTHHYSPFVSPSSNKIGYHRCRGTENAHNLEPRVEYVKSPLAGVTLVRIHGEFGEISPDGTLVAYNDDQNSLAVMKLDGSSRRVVYKGPLYGTAWDPTGKGTVYISTGEPFADESASVRIVAVSNAYTADVDADATSSSSKYLTKEGTGNNAFPAVSPDGKYVVFRSGRSGHNNLYIMDAAEGEEKYLRRLTEGAWTDTMPAWSPDGEWIAFSSNRVIPGERSYSLYMIRPNGTDLRMMFDTGYRGLANHIAWSPDCKRIAFSGNLAGVSSEPISWPHGYLPYGELFVVNVDGTGLTRLTHNSYEDGVPTWGALRPSKVAVATQGEYPPCDFEDVRFLNTSSEPLYHGRCPRGPDRTAMSVATL